MKSQHFTAIQKRAQADQRAALRTERSDRQQLERLIDRGAGHCREALRLQARLDARKTKPKSRKVTK